MQPWAESKQSAAILLEDGSFNIYAWSAKALLKFHDLSHVIGVGCFNIIKCVIPPAPIWRWSAAPHSASWQVLVGKVPWISGLPLCFRLTYGLTPFAHIVERMAHCRKQRRLTWSISAIPSANRPDTASAAASDSREQRGPSTSVWRELSRYKSTRFRPLPPGRPPPKRRTYFRSPW